jgi:hypothetical protein
MCDVGYDVQALKSSPPWHGPLAKPGLDLTSELFIQPTADPLVTYDAERKEQDPRSCIVRRRETTLSSENGAALMFAVVWVHPGMRDHGFTNSPSLSVQAFQSIMPFQTRSEVT